MIAVDPNADVEEEPNAEDAVDAPNPADAVANRDPDVGAPPKTDWAEVEAGNVVAIEVPPPKSEPVELTEVPKIEDVVGVTLVPNRETAVVAVVATAVDFTSNKELAVTLDTPPNKPAAVVVVLNVDPLPSETLPNKTGEADEFVLANGKLLVLPNALSPLPPNTEPLAVAVVSLLLITVAAIEDETVNVPDDKSEVTADPDVVTFFWLSKDNDAAELTGVIVTLEKEGIVNALVEVEEVIESSDLEARLLIKETFKFRGACELSVTTVLESEMYT